MIFVMERTFLSWKGQYCFVGEIAVKRLGGERNYQNKKGNIIFFEEDNHHGKSTYILLSV